MKRFWQDVTVAPADRGWRVALDGKPIRTQGGAPQVVPVEALARALASEWEAQGETVDPKAFVLRDLADFAIDQVVPDAAAAVARLLPYAETDTLCYRADPDEPLYRRQQELWEPLIAGCESRHGVILERVSGIVHRPQPPETLAKLRGVLEARDDFTLAALQNLASLATSLVTGLAALEPEADAEQLFAAADCEEDWQAEQWGWETEAKKRRDARLAGFVAAAEFAKAARG
jgi:chaperone required for assembly of F1-ATPase